MTLGGHAVGKQCVKVRDAEEKAASRKNGPWPEKRPLKLLAGQSRASDGDGEQRRQHQRFRTDEDQDAENHSRRKKSFLPPKHEGNNCEQSEEAAFETVRAGGPEIDVEQAGKRDEQRRQRINATHADGCSVGDVERQSSAKDADHDREYLESPAQRNGHREK